MRRLIFSFIIAILAIIFVFKVNISHAQEAVIQTDTPIGVEMIATPSSQSSTRVNYELPYPGMLPDHPLYILKVLRDGVVKILINDDIKRARFSLESAEKRIYAGKMLVDKNKDQLAIETMGKGNNYLNDALKAINEAKKKNPKNTDIHPFLLQFRTAMQKHQEVVGDMEPNIAASYEQQFKIEKERVRHYLATVEKMLLEKQ